MFEDEEVFGYGGIYCDDDFFVVGGDCGIG